MPHKKLIALDFDGVLHSYTSPWTDAATISDPPTPGAMAFLRQLVEDGRFKVVICTSRVRDKYEAPVVREWIVEHLAAEFGAEVAAKTDAGYSIHFGSKPPAHVTLDDRALTFDGPWPDLDELAAFKPWNKRPARPDVETRLRELAARCEDFAGGLAITNDYPFEDTLMEWFREAIEIAREAA